MSILLKIHGGTGNQMFQYALGIRLSKDMGVPLKLDLSGFSINPRPYQLDQFRIEAHVLTTEELARERPWAAGWRPRRLTRLMRYWPIRAAACYVQETQFNFDPSILTVPDHVYLDGCWQSESYFGTASDTVRDHFQLAVPMTEARRETAALMQETNAVSLHVRRGDYVSNATNLAYHGTCPPQWYERAMTAVSDLVAGPFFYVFSDDPEWARANLPDRWPMHFVDPQTDKRDFEDIHLMAQCRHHIIANSSFSWWGAWLNPSPDKVVIAPRQWFGPAAKLDTRDIIPPSWIRM